jgi:hypothetical protein
LDFLLTFTFAVGTFAGAECVKKDVIEESKTAMM